MPSRFITSQFFFVIHNNYHAFELTHKQRPIARICVRDKGIITEKKISWSSCYKKKKTQNLLLIK